jgi:hypothetical protein
MRAPLTDAELDERLAVLGLVRDPTVTSPPPSKNRTVVCKTKTGKKRVLVKISDGPGTVGVLREGSVLERVEPLSRAPRSPLHLPKVVAFDPAHGLLGLEWIPNTETLHHFHRRSGEYPVSLAAQVGHHVASGAELAQRHGGIADREGPARAVERAVEIEGFWQACAFGKRNARPARQGGRLAGGKAQRPGQVQNLACREPAAEADGGRTTLDYNLER